MQSKALFLDRDGVINLDHGYVSQPDDIDFIDDVFALCRRFQQQGYLIIIVTNQSGIARGYYTEEQFIQLGDWIHQQFKSQQVEISKTFYCPHHPESGLGEYRQRCSCRKPEPGMLLDAAKQFNINLAESVMVGDKQSDMLAAKRAGINQRYLYLSSATADKRIGHATQVILSLEQLQVDC